MSGAGCQVSGIKWQHSGIIKRSDIWHPAPRTLLQTKKSLSFGSLRIAPVFFILVYPDMPDPEAHPLPRRSASPLTD
jgi:hypothetical protein